MYCRRREGRAERRASLHCPPDLATHSHPPRRPCLSSSWRQPSCFDALSLLLVASPICPASLPLSSPPPCTIPLAIARRPSDLVAPPSPHSLLLDLLLRLILSRAACPVACRVVVLVSPGCRSDCASSSRTAPSDRAAFVSCRPRGLLSPYRLAWSWRGWVPLSLWPVVLSGCAAVTSCVHAGCCRVWSCYGRVPVSSWPAVAFAPAVVGSSWPVVPFGCTAVVSRRPGGPSFRLVASLSCPGALVVRHLVRPPPLSPAVLLVCHRVCLRRRWVQPSLWHVFSHGRTTAAVSCCPSGASLHLLAPLS
jgi:hypothetical protein